MADQNNIRKNGTKTEDAPIRKVREINLLWVFLSPYKSTIFKAMIALVVAAGSTLAIPQAIRRIIDMGFSSVSIDLINLYFLALLRGNEFTKNRLRIFKNNSNFTRHSRRF